MLCARTIASSCNTSTRSPRACWTQRRYRSYKRQRMSEPQPGQDNLVGRTIGAFQVQAEVGRSHWGKVYRAIQTTVNRVVALKVLSPESARDASNVESFLAESQDAAQIVH